MPVHQSRQPRKKGKGKGGGIVKRVVGKSSYYFAQGLKMGRMGRKSVVEHKVRKIEELEIFFAYFHQNLARRPLND